MIVFFEVRTKNTIYRNKVKDKNILFGIRTRINLLCEMMYRAGYLKRRLG